MKLIRERLHRVEDEVSHPEKGILRISWFDEEKEVRAYTEKMERIFDEEVEFWPREEIRDHSLTDRDDDAYLKPYGLPTPCSKFTCHRGRLAAEKGARIHEKSPVLGVKKRGDGWHVRTRNDAVLANQIVGCCSRCMGRSKHDVP